MGPRNTKPVVPPSGPLNITTETEKESDAEEEEYFMALCDNGSFLHAENSGDSHIETEKGNCGADVSSGEEQNILAKNEFVNADVSSNGSFTEDIVPMNQLSDGNNLKEVANEEISMPVLKRKLKELVGMREQTHLDYKRQLYLYSGDSNSERKKAEAAGYTKILADIMAMYNTPEKYGQPFHSISGQSFCASFIVFGIDYKENRPKNFLACPIDHSDKNRGFIDENSLQDQIRSRFTYYIPTAYHEISIIESDLTELQSKGIQWMKTGYYGLLEIAHDKTHGPVFARLVTDNKTGRSTKNDIANKLYVRQQATTMLVSRKENLPIEKENSKEKREQENRKDFERECYSKFDPKYSEYSNILDSLKNTIKPAKFFKVLISTACSPEGNKELTEFMSSLFQVKWNLVIYTGKEEPDEESFSEFLKQETKLPITKLLPEEMDGLQDQGWKGLYEEIASQERCLFTFKRDGAEKSKYCSKISSLTTKIFGYIDLPLQLVVFNLVLEPSTIDIVANLCETVQNAWETEKNPAETDDETFVNGYSVSISHHGSLLNATSKYMSQGSKRDGESHFFAVAPFQQLDYFFQNLHEEKKKINLLTLPGSAGKVTVPDAELKCINQYFQVYSMAMCIEWWQSLSSDERENCKPQICQRFLSGYPIEPNGLYLHKSGIKTVYIKREKMDDTCKLVRSAMKNVENESTKENIIRLSHEPSAGGTTLGRAVLWEICDEYPAIILTKWNDNNCSDIISCLNSLYDRCRTPICILIDNSILTNMHDRDVKNFANTVSRRTEIKIVILFVVQMSNNKNEAVSQIIIYNELTDNERAQLDELMKTASVLLKNTPSKTIPLYALCQFGRNYRLLEENLRRTALHGSKNDKTLLLLAAIVYYYSRQLLPFYFVAKVLEEDPEQFYNSLDEKLHLLGTARDFLLVQEFDAPKDNLHHGIRPVSSFVSKKILDLAFGEPKVYMISFVDELVQQINESKLCVLAVMSVARPLFVQRQFSLEGKKEQFSDFVNDLESCNDIETTAKQLERLANSIGDRTTEDGPHIHAMFARYTAYKQRNIEKALRIMKKALIVSEYNDFHTTKSNDSILLNTAAVFIAMKLEEMLKESHNNDNLFSMAIHFFNDATLILRKAQKNELNCSPFITEVRLCYHFMYLYYVIKCKKNVALFTELLLKKDVPELEQAAEVAHKKLSDLECLLQKHHMEGYGEKETEEMITKLKMKLLGLKVDIENISQDNFIQQCKSDVWLASGVVDFFFYRMKLRQQVKPCFEMLAPQALETIIELLQEHVSSGLTRSNYKHIIMAVIYFYNKCPPRLRQGNLNVAQNYAQLWIKAYPDDNRAHYYLALFSLIRAIGFSQGGTIPSTLKKEQIGKMNDHYSKCKKLLEVKRANDKLSTYKWHPSELNFVIGNYNTLAALIPKDSNFVLEKVKHELNLKIFTGKAKSIQEAHILWCDELKREVFIPGNLMRTAWKHRKEIRQYWFILATRTNGFYVEDFTEDPRVRYIAGTSRVSNELNESSNGIEGANVSKRRKNRSERFVE